MLIDRKSTCEKIMTELTLVPKMTVRSILWGVARPSLLRSASLVLLGSLLMAVGAKISIPLQPVPFSLQSLAVLFVGLTCGFKIGVISVLVYLAAGFLGLPVFSTDGHYNLMLGYLIGFLLAAGVVGFLAERGWARHVFSTITAALLGTAIILFCGWLVLSQFMSMAVAFDNGIKPFLLGAALKAIVLAVVVPVFWRSTGKGT